MRFRDLKQQYQLLKADMDKAILDAVASGAYIMGPQVKDLEKELAAYVGTRHCISCASGTDALTLALKAWGVGKGDAVFVPDFTFFSPQKRSHWRARPLFLSMWTAPLSISILRILRKKSGRPCAEENWPLK